MADAYSLGSFKTDTTTGRNFRVGHAGGTLNNSGACMQWAGADYQVTAGKTFYLTGFQVITKSNTSSALEVRRADNAALTTNPVQMLAIFNAGASVTVSVGNFTTWTNVFGATAPASKYVGVFQSVAVATTIAVWLIGYEA